MKRGIALLMIWLLSPVSHAAVDCPKDWPLWAPRIADITFEIMDLRQSIAFAPSTFEKSKVREFCDWAGPIQLKAERITGEILSLQSDTGFVASPILQSLNMMNTSSSILRSFCAMGPSEFTLQQEVAFFYLNLATEKLHAQVNRSCDEIFSNRNQDHIDWPPYKP